MRQLVGESSVELAVALVGELVAELGDVVLSS